MATQSLSVTASGSFSLTDSDGNSVFSYSPSFTTAAEVTDSQLMHTGEILTNGTSATTINDATMNNKDCVYTFIKHVDTDYVVTVIPDGDIIAHLNPGECMFSPVHVDGAGDASNNLDIQAATAAQKVQYLICDGKDTGINTDD
tara:strand:+ start:3165 stop:3596 length:432 start_codon:yes stop_codon:yes gene_type:complete